MDKTAETRSRLLARWLALPPENLLQLLQGSCRLCMSNFLPTSRVNLSVSEQNGTPLLQMANELSGLNITDQSDYGLSMDVCLSCAGNLVNFYQFRKACQNNEKEIQTILTAIRLKLKCNQTNGVEDDDCHLIYVCRCKQQFDNHSEYIEHKKTHHTASVKVNTTDSANSNVSNWSLLQSPNKVPAPVPLNSETVDMKYELDQEQLPSTSSFKCHQCAILFINENEYLLHIENTHKTVPPLILRKSNSANGIIEVVESNGMISEQIDVNVDPSDIEKVGGFKCNQCSASFDTNRGMLIHAKHRHSNTEPKRRKRGRGRMASAQGKICSYTCSECGERFAKYFQKYHHQRNCTGGTLNKSRNAMSDGEEYEVTESFVGALDEMKRKCSVCVEVFNSPRAKTMHESKVHNLDLRECRNCKQIFSSYATRYVHEKTCNFQAPIPPVEV